MGNNTRQENIEKLAKYVAVIHSQSINQSHLKKYNAEWVAEQVEKIKDVQFKNDIILAIKTMSQIESHNASPKEAKFLAWDISRLDWQQEYKSGRAGSYAWDIACIINRANDVKFSDIFLKSYLRHGGQKITLAALYANLYYVRVFEAIKSGIFENIIEDTRKIIDESMFKSDVISYETLVALGVTGY